MNHLLGRTAPRTQSRSPITALKRWTAALARMMERARTRRLLAQLNEQQLSDMGISHSERIAELDKPFWR